MKGVIRGLAYGSGNDAKWPVDSHSAIIDLQLLQRSELYYCIITILLYTVTGAQKPDGSF